MRSLKDRAKGIALVMGLLGGGLLGGGSLQAAGDPAKGQELYAKCVSCHGASGEGNEAQKGPRLAGQHDWYLLTQLKNFRDNKRNNPAMFPFIKGLTDKEMEDLAAHISKLK